MSTTSQTEYTHLLTPQNAILLIVDIQDRLFPHMHEGKQLADNTAILIQSAYHLGIPIIVSEQYPRGLGSTIPQLQQLLAKETLIFEKRAFGCWEDAAIRNSIQSLARPQLLVCGIETHICMSQTVHQLLDADYEVHIAVDATTSREETSKQLGLQKMQTSGAILTNTEMAMFELLQTSRHPQFKALQSLIK